MPVVDFKNQQGQVKTTNEILLEFDQRVTDIEEAISAKKIELMNLTTRKEQIVAQKALFEACNLEKDRRKRSMSDSNLERIRMRLASFNFSVKEVKAQLTEKELEKFTQEQRLKKNINSHKRRKIRDNIRLISLEIEAINKNLSGLQEQQKSAKADLDAITKRFMN